MGTWQVTYEVRSIGAIGLFRPLSDDVEADTMTGALQAFRDKYAPGHEFRNPILCVRI